MLVWQRVLRVAVPAALLSAFLIWMSAAPSANDRGRARRSQRPFERGAPAGSPADAGTQRLLEQAVAGQIAALRKGDYDSALRFSSTAFRENYSAEAFREMILRGFPQLGESEKTTCHMARCTRNRAAVPVTLEGRDGAKTHYMYHLSREGDVWLIRSVVPRDAFGLPSPPVPARQQARVRTI